MIKTNRQVFIWGVSHILFVGVCWQQYMEVEEQWQMRKAWEMLFVDECEVCVWGEGGSGVRGVQIQVRTQKIYKYFLKCVSRPLYSPLCDKCS